uniref:Uncharacterized protein n=1 Tax=Anopheles merus TaxID=30066 RepID=A0A182V9H0_ANOME
MLAIDPLQLGIDHRAHLVDQLLELQHLLCVLGRILRIGLVYQMQQPVNLFLVDFHRRRLQQMLLLPVLGTVLLLLVRKLDTLFRALAGRCQRFRLDGQVGGDKVGWEKALPALVLTLPPVWIGIVQHHDDFAGLEHTTFGSLLSVVSRFGVADGSLKSCPSSRSFLYSDGIRSSCGSDLNTSSAQRFRSVSFITTISTRNITQTGRIIRPGGNSASNPYK